MTFSKKEQFKLLETKSVYELEQQFGFGKLKEVFDIAEPEYCEWECKRPISSSIRTTRQTYDGMYFIHENNKWKVYWQERGHIRPEDLCVSKDYAVARLFLCKITMPYFVVRTDTNIVKKAPNKPLQRGTFKRWLSSLRSLF